ncbi:Wzz/FepE/Etk N-terminal domain-containing protein [Cyclobacterium sp.]|uniref:Wzz/FepE/Etk N-terminal domain-containing protein n=1 Tax=Cyclobacterium sp. TaxID=1966343 RepID=UPI0019A55CFE|nr:Wzz/FepE/Etk N-terminal domain-containing protein [Cyclobacterium sp.]MBD3627436.1 hypothetical protein [Cyclobacterium sp.]
MGTKLQVLDKFISDSFQNEEINIKELVKTILNFKIWIFLVTIVVFLLGLIFIISSPDEYVAKSKLLLEQQQGFSGKSLGGLAGISGLGNLGLGNQGSESIPAELIPELVMESDFLKELIYEKIEIPEERDSVTLIQFVNEYEKHDFYYHLFRLPALISTQLSSTSAKDKNNKPQPIISSEDQDILSLNSEERKAIVQLRSRIQIEKEDRLLLIQTKMQNPVGSAQLNGILIRKLKSYLTDLILEKEIQNFEFIQKRTNEAKSRVESTQKALARFRDSNRGINSQLVKTEEDRLQSDFNLEFSVYNSLAQQLEQARIKVQEATPLLNVFQRPQIPTSNSEPKYVLLGMVFLVSGFVLAILSFFGLLVFQILKFHFSNV